MFTKIHNIYCVLFLTFIIVYAPFLSAQSASEKEIKAVCDSLYQISNTIIQNEGWDTDKKLEKTDSLLKDVIKIEEGRFVSCVVRPKIILLFQTGRLKEGLEAEHLLLNIAKKHNLQNDIITSRNNLNIFHYRLGQLDSALFYLTENYEDLKNTNNIFAKGANLNGLVKYYLSAENLDKAIYYNEKLEELGEEENHSETLKNAYYNKVTIYKQLGNEDMAIDFANKSLAIDSNNITVLNELGLLYKRQEKYEKSLAIFKRLLDILNPENTYALAAINNNIGVVFNLKKEYRKAIPYLKEGLNYSKIAGASSFEEVALDELSIAYSEVKDFEKGMYYLTKLYTLRDSLQSIELKERVAGLENTIELKEKNAELQLSEAEKLLKEQDLQAKNKQILIAGFSIIVFIIILVYVIIVNNKLKKTKIALENSNATKDRFFSIIAHDLRSPIIALQGIGNRLTKHINNKNIERVERLAPELDKSLSNVNFLLDNLLNWAVSQQGSIPLKIENISLNDLIKEVVSTAESAAKHKGVEIKIEADEMQVAADYNSLSLILRNLLSNAIKFSPENGVVSIVAKNASTKSIEIIDEGKGINNEQLEKINKAIYFSDAQKGGEKGFGIGLSLVHEFAKLNKLQLKINSEINKGSQFSIIFN